MEAYARPQASAAAPTASDLLERLLSGHDLDEAAAASLMHRLAGGSDDPAQAGALLVALRAKGETAAELRGFARAMRERAVRPGLATAGAVDVVGTGGDGSGSLNLSTGSALLAAACGVPVIKHGNRSISSRCGSADVLESLGYTLPADGPAAARSFARCGFTFLFAPAFHPAMRRLADVRRALGVRTVLNLLGPLTNPAEPPFFLVGACNPRAAELLAGALAGMPIHRAFVVHGEPGWDEATPVGPFRLHDVRPGRVLHGIEDPADYGLARCRPEDLAGGDAAHNGGELRAALSGRTGPHRNALTLGAALVLRLTGRARGPRQAVARAEAAIDDGSARQLVERLGESGGDQP